MQIGGEGKSSNRGNKKEMDRFFFDHAVRVE